MNKAGPYQGEALRCAGLKATPLISRCIFVSQPRILMELQATSDTSRALRSRFIQTRLGRNTDPVRLEHWLLNSCRIQEVSVV